MKESTVIVLHVLGWVALTPFLLFGALALVLGLSGELDEGGSHAPWYTSVGLAAIIWACGLPGLALVVFTWNRLRRAGREADVGQGFPPVFPHERR